MEHWQDISPQVSFPKGMRHGTVLRVPQAVIQNLQQAVPNQKIDQTHNEKHD
jgi:hypothetical protein